MITHDVPRAVAFYEVLTGAVPNYLTEDFVDAERLGWVAGRLAVVDRPFVVEFPRELQDEVFALGQRLITASRRQSGA